MSLSFSTKGNTLKRLRKKIASAKVADLIIFTINEWQSNPRDCITKVKNKFKNSSLIVRSSNKEEDCSNNSNAGAFLSLLDVSIENIVESIDKVINSYRSDDKSNQILIQPMLSDVIRSGVAFSHDPNTLSNYRVINWSEGKDTTAVTGGIGQKIWQQVPKKCDTTPKKVKAVVDLIEELLCLFDNKPLDIEFAFTLEKNKFEQLWLLQVRPLVLKDKIKDSNNQNIILNRIEEKLEKLIGPHPFLNGKKTIYGVMPDWNPAEIIGFRPRPLAFSLYRELITDSIWAYQRKNYGYRDLRSFPLIIDLNGFPYVDVRVSFDSFIPSNLDESLADKLINYYIEKLIQEPKLHDKIEFEIVFSAYTFDLENRLRTLSQKGFSSEERLELKDKLRELTNKIINPKTGLWKIDSEKIEVLNRRRKLILESNRDQIEIIYWLLEDTKRWGTLPFAGLARAGFIGIQILRSLVSTGLIEEKQYSEFLENIDSITRSLKIDKANLNKDQFLKKYGHLRPGTYDICSPRYDETPDNYFCWEEEQCSEFKFKEFNLDNSQNKKIDNFLKKNELQIDVEGLFEFIKSSITQREYAKFCFTKNLSEILCLVSKFGNKYGLSNNDLSFSNIQAFKDIYSSTYDIKNKLLNSIDFGKASYEETLTISLPPLIKDPKDCWGFYWPETEPNYITNKKITSNIVSLKDRNKLKNSIVFIQNADPGYDWIFSYGIGAFITAWGGSNSHMAIRAGELGLPAIVGCGEILFTNWSKAKVLFIDCANKKVDKVS